MPPSRPARAPSPRAGRRAASIVLAASLALPALSVLSCGPVPRALSRVGPAEFAAALEKARGMPLEERSGQLVVAAVSGSRSLPAGEAEFLRELKPGAVILFAYNVSPVAEEARAFADAVMRAVPGEPPLVAADQEGGTVQRYRAPLGDLPSARVAGEKLGAAGLLALGAAVGKELAMLGCGLELAPVAEAGGGEESFSRGRYYSADPDVAADLAGAFLRGLQASVPCAAKHFPSMTAVDPHRSLPTLAAPRDELEKGYFAPFKELLAEDGAEALMVSHVLVPAIDGKLPASLSPAIVRGVVREGMGFRGLVLTDDLCMGALSGYGGPARTAVLAVAAGVDMVMVLDGASALAARDALVAAVRGGELPESRLDEACARVLALKKAYRGERPAFSAPALAELKRRVTAILSAPPPR